MSELGNNLQKPLSANFTSGEVEKIGIYLKFSDAQTSCWLLTQCGSQDHHCSLVLLEGFLLLTYQLKTVLIWNNENLFLQQLHYSF